MKKFIIILLACGLGFGFNSCNDEDCNALHLNDLAHIPNVLKGTFPTEPVILNLGETLTITPQLLDPGHATFSWMLNGIEVSTKPEFKITMDKPYRGNLTCIISNRYGSVEMSTQVFSNHNFSNGFFYIAGQEIHFFDALQKKTYENCFSSLNGGKLLKIKDPNIYARNGKIYIVSNSNISNEDHLYVIDAQTLFLEKTASICTHLHSMIFLNNQYALLNGNGIKRINLETLQYTNLTNENRYIFNGIAFQNRLLTNDTFKEPSNVKQYHLDEWLTATENNIPENINPSLDIVQMQKTNFVETPDGRVFTLETRKEGCSIVEINADLSIQKTAINFTPCASPYWTSPTIGMSLSKNGQSIYLPAENKQIYKYNIDNPHSLEKPFIKAVESRLPIAAPLQINPETGDLYVIYGEEGNEYEIAIYNEEGTKIHSISCQEKTPPQVFFTNK